MEIGKWKPETGPENSQAAPANKDYGEFGMFRFRYSVLPVGVYWNFAAAVVDTSPV